MKRQFAPVLAFLLVASSVSAQSVFTLRAASETAISAASTSNEASPRFGGRRASITLDFTTLTLPDADDEIDFYVQTTYDGGTTWTDVENIHFSNADDGSTVTRIIFIDGAKDGPGTVQSIAGTNPAAAAELSEAVPANAIWRLLSLSASLVTDSNAANRQVSFTLDDGTTVYGRFHINTSIIADQTVVLVLAPGLLRGGTSTISMTSPAPIPTLLPAAHRIRTIVTSIQAGDDWGAPQLSVEAWHDPSISTDATMGDNLRSYDRPLGTRIRVDVTITGASAPTYDYSAVGIFH